MGRISSGLLCQSGPAMRGERGGLGEPCAIEPAGTCAPPAPTKSSQAASRLPPQDEEGGGGGSTIAMCCPPPSDNRDVMYPPSPSRATNRVLLRLTPLSGFLFRTSMFFYLFLHVGFFSNPPPPPSRSFEKINKHVGVCLTSSIPLRILATVSGSVSGP